MSTDQIIAIFAWLLGQAGVVAAIVAAVRGNAWVQANAKVVVAILNVTVYLVGQFGGFVPAELSGAVVGILTAVVTALSTVGVYKFVIEPVQVRLAAGRVGAAPPARLF
jgi:hypothetical protein